MSTAATNKADQSTKADYEIPVDLIDEKVVPHVPHHLKLGKTVHYESKAGKVEIEFHNGSPFGSTKTTVTSNDPPLELKVKGNFLGNCSITTPDGVKHGWPALSSRTAGTNTTGANTAGANHDVQ